jgi:hypothetical protein
MKSGNLNLLEPSGPVQACNGIALPLPFTFTSLGFQWRQCYKFVKIQDGTSGSGIRGMDWIDLD